MLSLKPINGTSALTYSSKNGNRKSSYCRASARVTTKSNNGSNFYEFFSLESEKVGFDEIKKAYRSMALRYHPDVCPGSTKEESTNMFVELHRAYVVLSDPSSRRAYDMEMLAGEPDGVKVRSGRFAKETWEAQLHELAMRSDNRERTRSEFTMV